MADSVRFKLSNCKLAIASAITSKDKIEIDKEWRYSILKLPNFAKRTKQI